MWDMILGSKASGGTTTHIKSWNGVLYANMKNVNGVAMAYVKSINGLE
jgi:hypothetical protein